ncbi:uncharacterized protein LOC118821760 [Colossoma macropomum]|uniref:uncharacterized protein LOC118821760 n=1 Tax=Colossoma macropomum TaxID=42526 RepID=UPI0018647295|nr:uncharacterized protein LOC118821760 [Colossoma macropomum]
MDAAFIAGVSGVTVVTQKPPVLTATKGEKTTMHCNLGTVTNTARWLPPLSPLFILHSVHHSADHTDNMLPTLCALLPALTCKISLPAFLCTLMRSLVPALSPLSAPQAAHLFTQHRESSHTDKMLPALCSLFTALSCVSGVTVVTQKPPVLTLTKGEKAVMDCNMGTVTDFSANWYKQLPDGAPHHVLRFRITWGSPSYGSGFSSPKFTSTCSSIVDCSLIISNVEEGDSAVYHCTTYDSSARQWVSQ